MGTDLPDTDTGDATPGIASNARTRSTGLIAAYDAFFSAMRLEQSSHALDSECVLATHLASALALRRQAVLIALDQARGAPRRADPHSTTGGAEAASDPFADLSSERIEQLERVFASAGVNTGRWTLVTTLRWLHEVVAETPVAAARALGSTPALAAAVHTACTVLLTPNIMAEPTRVARGGADARAGS